MVANSLVNDLHDRSPGEVKLMRRLIRQIHAAGQLADRVVATHGPLDPREGCLYGKDALICPLARHRNKAFWKLPRTAVQQRYYGPKEPAHFIAERIGRMREIIRCQHTFLGHTDSAWP